MSSDGSEYARAQERARKARYEQAVLDSVGGAEFLRRDKWSFTEQRYLQVAVAKGQPLLFVACVLKRKYAAVAYMQEKLNKPNRQNNQGKQARG